MEISAGIELTIYFAVFIGAQLYSLVQFSLQSQDLLGNLLLEYPDDFSVNCITSWKLPLVSWTCHQPVDISDDEWRVAREFLLSTKVLYLVGHCLGWAIVRRISKRHLPHFTILYSLLCLFRILGPGPLLLIAANICLSFILTFILQHQNLFPSSSSLPSSVLLHYLLFTVCLVANNLYHADLHNFEVNLLFNLSVSWLNAKLLSAALDSRKEQKELLLLQKLTYLLYYPSFFFGPIFHFEDFARALGSVISARNQFKISHLLLRTFFWALVFDLLLKRLLYSSAFLNYPQYLSSSSSSSDTISAWALAGFGFSLMLLFFLKYRVLYGVSKAVAEEVDGLSGNVFARPPQCIAHMATTAYLWRHFDQGLYAFLFRYFYAPLTGGKGAPLWRRALASSVCFAAIAAWHEQLTSPAIALWVGLNFLLLNVEQAGRFLKTRLQKSSIFPKEAFFTRLECLAGAPHLLLAYLSNILFLSNTETLMAILGRLLESPTFTATLLVVLYAGCHVCKAINSSSGSKRR